VGPQGRGGFNHAWSAENTGASVGSAYTTVAQVSVPAGTYLFFAKAVVTTSFVRFPATWFPRNKKPEPCGSGSGWQVRPETLNFQN
jgi:hypothetical protein